LDRRAKTGQCACARLECREAAERLKEKKARPLDADEEGFIAFNELCDEVEKIISMGTLPFTKLSLSRWEFGQA
jgi:hypothetical protein